MKNKKYEWEWECKCGTMHSINELQCSKCKEDCDFQPLHKVKNISNQNKSKDQIVYQSIVSLVKLVKAKNKISGATDKPTDPIPQSRIYSAALKTLVQLGFAKGNSVKDCVIFWDKIKKL